jgi:NADH:ubiquinone oxidoreductase subunit H
LKLSDIAVAQAGGAWFIFYPVIGQLAFIAFMVSTLAAENRVPFDIPKPSQSWWRASGSSTRA